jgi:ribosome-associated toxin RatA of RatAB toxin-antitoxin module
MIEVRKQVLVLYTPAEMFELVDRVEDYPRFLPWCGRTELHERNTEVTEASLLIDYHGIHQRFTTRNHKEAPYLMHIDLKDGPFRHMQGHWRFTPLGPDGSRVEFALDYEFSNALFDRILSPVFSYIAGNLVDAFIVRAEQVYGVR